MMYSGDEYYGDEITSPIERPIYTMESEAFNRWLTKLESIIQRKVGCSLDDLEDYPTRDGFDDGLTPNAFYREYIAPEVGME